MAQMAYWTEPPMIFVSVSRLFGLGMVFIGLSLQALTLFCSRGIIGEQHCTEKSTDSGAVLLLQMCENCGMRRGSHK